MMEDDQSVAAFMATVSEGDALTGTVAEVRHRHRPATAPPRPIAPPSLRTPMSTGWRCEDPRFEELRADAVELDDLAGTPEENAAISARRRPKGALEARRTVSS
jgi:hypothetical protein